MKRLLAHLVLTGSTLLCVLAMALWGLSYVAAVGWSWSDGVRVPTAGYPVAWRKAVVSVQGRLYLIHDRGMGGIAHSRRLRPQEVSALPSVDDDHRYAGFGHQVHTGYPIIASTTIGPPVELTRAWCVPYWFPVIMTAMPIGAWIIRRRRTARRARERRCLTCGYDLRATPERCPECGAKRTTGRHQPSHA